MLAQLKKIIVDWCANVTSVSVEQLHTNNNPDCCEIYDNDKLKFVQQTAPTSVSVLTPTGFKSLKHTFQTVQYNTYRLILRNGSMLDCADEHIVLLKDNTQCHVRSLRPGHDIVKTSEGFSEVVSVINLNNIQPMYDLELSDTDHVYYTNNILSHNSITSGAFLLWFAMFNFDKTVLIASNKNSNAMEMIHRIRYMYEQMPVWLKPGVNDDGWNKHNLGFDNGSRIISEATSENSGRGLSISLVFLDEFAFVSPAVQTEFWTSIAPTLSTGGSCIITSTPNGDSDIFAELWRGAEVGANGFAHQFVPWDAPPGRDDNFKQDEIGRIGQRKWEQEYECLDGDSMVDIQLPNGTFQTVSINELYNMCS